MLSRQVKPGFQGSPGLLECSPPQCNMADLGQRPALVPGVLAHARQA